ncbi:putative Calcium/calmodulin-dependent protein kinase kinase 2 [Blattamonas nauphoetae]|uniref:Calcium/calmodulin-dependent protein kinase kinase 2 n=1 Tax=Blattamonas nauphoetae TaxID=2049346 RepID=A0ABQ9XYY3_9EUKA|nr:putative Calcium/calmodulin-dependent protein kinase kinase 2 [Blattamonas nauphoetae]
MDSETASVCSVVESVCAESRRSSRTGRKMLNQYILAKTIGKGAYGKVKLCFIRDNPDTLYAIKQVKKKLKKGSGKSGGQEKTWVMDSLSKEVAIMKQMDHPHLVKLYEVIDDPKHSKMYMVLEYLEGGTLTIRNNSFYPEDVVHFYFHQLVTGIAFLHQHNIAHHDIKPDNVLLSNNNVLKVSDFGASIMYDSQNETIRGIRGTPVFIPPEACCVPPREDGYSPFLADLWALGILLFNLLFGHVPFIGSTVTLTYKAINEEELDLDAAETDLLARKKMDLVHDEILCRNVELQDDEDSLSQEDFERPSEGVRHLIKRLLDKNPSTRMTMAELLDDPWLTANGADPIELSPSVLSAVSPTDVALALSSIYSRHKMKALQKRQKRRQQQHQLNTQQDESDAGETSSISSMSSIGSGFSSLASAGSFFSAGSSMQSGASWMSADDRDPFEFGVYDEEERENHRKAADMKLDVPEEEVPMEMEIFYLLGDDDPLATNSQLSSVRIPNSLNNTPRLLQQPASTLNRSSSTFSSSVFGPATLSPSPSPAQVESQERKERKHTPRQPQFSSDPSREDDAENAPLYIRQQSQMKSGLLVNPKQTRSKVSLPHSTPFSSLVGTEFEDAAEIEEVDETFWDEESTAHISDVNITPVSASALCSQHSSLLTNAHSVSSDQVLNEPLLSVDQSKPNSVQIPLTSTKIRAKAIQPNLPRHNTTNLFQSSPKLLKRSHSVLLPGTVRLPSERKREERRKRFHEGRESRSRFGSSTPSPCSGSPFSSPYISPYSSPTDLHTGVHSRTSSKSESCISLGSSGPYQTRKARLLKIPTHPKIANTDKTSFTK